MNRISKFFPLVLAVLLAFSCESFMPSMMNDEKLVSSGTAAWNEKGPEAAAKYWTLIKDENQKKTRMGYVDKATALSADTKAMAGRDATDEAKELAAYEKAFTSCNTIPAELEVPEDVVRNMRVIGAKRAQAQLDAGNPAKAKEIADASMAKFGETPEMAVVLADTGTLLPVKQMERTSDDALADARANEDFYDKIAGYEKAAGLYSNAETALVERSKADKTDGRPAIASMASRLKKKRQDTRLEMERQLRERQYSFKDRIGEEFARVPEGDKLGTMSLEELLQFQQEIRANVEESYQELKKFGDRFPAVIDKNMLREVEDQKNLLNQKIAQVEQEIRTAKDIASRGKPVMPLLIGLFNPQPGGKAGDQKSRPALLRGSVLSKPEYWWGMVSIPKDTLNDLVVTMKDDRTIRVFPDNTKSGALIGQNGIKDLVNMGYKMGNSWPVLNAGKQLSTEKYYLEVQKGKALNFEGEVVIYSSFIMRMR